MNILSKTWVVFFISIALLTVNFSSHFISTLPLKRFLNNEHASEQFMITRIAVNNDLGLGFKGGFMSAAPFAMKELYMATNKDPYKDFRQRALEQKDEHINYNSHIGFQDDLLYPVWSGLYKVRDIVLDKAKDGSRMQRRMTHYDSYYIVKGTQYVVALLNAIALSLLLVWVMKEFSAPVAYLSLGFILTLAPDLTFFGRSMWWMMFSWFLPFLTILGAYYINKGRALSPLWLGLTAIIAGALLTLKTAMGYEYTSAIMMATLIPVAYYAVSQKWTFKEWFMQCFVIGVFQLIAITLTLYLHYLALENNGIDGLAILENRFQIRAYGGDAAANASGAIQESIDVNLLSLYAHYIFTNTQMGLPQIILFIPLIIWFWKNRRDWRKGFSDDVVERGLLASILLGFLGALSMLTILKGHAYIHNFDIVVFSLPMNLFLFMLYAKWSVQNFRTNN